MESTEGHSMEMLTQSGNSMQKASRNAGESFIGEWVWPLERKRSVRSEVRSEVK